MFDKKDNPGDLLDSLFSPAPSEMNEVLTFMKDFGVTYSEEQLECMALLKYHGGFEWLLEFLSQARSMRLPTSMNMSIIKEMAKAQAASANPQMVGVMAEKK